MKHLMIPIASLFLLLSVFTNCSNETSDTSVTKPDSIQAPKNHTVSLNVKLFFKTYDGIDEEGNEYSSVIHERTFSEEKKYTFCYDSEEFDHILIEADGENFSIIVKNSKSTDYTKENFKIQKEITFTKQDFTFNVGEVYQIVITHAGTVVFEGTIDSQGCM